MTPFYLLIPTETKVNGIVKRVYPEITLDTPVVWGRYSQYSSGQKTVDGLDAVMTRRVIRMRYDERVIPACRLALAENPSVVFEIVSDVDDIHYEHKWMEMTVRNYAKT